MTTVLRFFHTKIILTLLISFFSFSSVQATELSPKLQVKLNVYKIKLTEWAKDPVIIKAVLHANKNNKKVAMNNKTWRSLTSTNDKVKTLLTSYAGQKLIHWKKDKSLGKLFLRDNKGNFVAGSQKPAIFNIADRPAFKNVIRGKIWNSKKPKADPTTKLSSIQLSIPVKNKGKEIGILHTSIIAD